jgi:hypothetical protein
MCGIEQDGVRRFRADAIDTKQGLARSLPRPISQTRDLVPTLIDNEFRQRLQPTGLDPMGARRPDQLGDFGFCKLVY